MPKTEEKMTLKPLGDKVVVEIIDEPQTTASGIVLPDTAKEKSQRGKVLAVGAGKLLENGERAALEVIEGDTVLFAKYGGTEITIAGKDLMILSERDIHAVVE
jgi:chaperonin GroES